MEPIVNNNKISELYSLTNSFNEMGERLTSLVTNLEKQVTLRTEELEHLNKELEGLSFKDGLTGIYNRRKFDKEYNLAWDTAQLHDRELAVLMLDIDYFKSYNDFYGHLKGDDCLKIIADELVKKIHNPIDLVARYGGEEFVILIQEPKEEKLLAFAEDIRVSIEGLKIEHSASKFEFATISIGIASMVAAIDIEPTELIARADLALYQAKAAGRNKVSKSPQDS